MERSIRALALPRLRGPGGDGERRDRGRSRRSPPIGLGADDPNLSSQIARLGDASICAEPLQKKVAKLLAKHAKAGGRLATKAGDTTKETKRRKLLGKLQKLLGRLVKKVDAAARRGKVGEACAFTVAEKVAAVQTLITPLVP